MFENCCALIFTNDVSSRSHILSTIPIELYTRVCKDTGALTLSYYFCQSVYPSTVLGAWSNVLWILVYLFVYQEAKKKSFYGQTYFILSIFCQLFRFKSKTKKSSCETFREDKCPRFLVFENLWESGPIFLHSVDPPLTLIVDLLMSPIVAF